MCKSLSFKNMSPMKSHILNIRDINHSFNNNLNNPDIKITSMAWSIPKLALKLNTTIMMTVPIHSLKTSCKTSHPFMTLLLIIDTPT